MAKQKSGSHTFLFITFLQYSMMEAIKAGNLTRVGQVTKFGGGTRSYNTLLVARLIELGPSYELRLTDRGENLLALPQRWSQPAVQNMCVVDHGTHFTSFVDEQDGGRPDLRRDLPSRPQPKEVPNV